MVWRFGVSFHCEIQSFYRALLVHHAMVRVDEKREQGFEVKPM